MYATPKSFMKHTVEREVVAVFITSPIAAIYSCSLVFHHNLLVVVAAVLEHAGDEMQNFSPKIMSHQRNVFKIDAT